MNSNAIQMLEISILLAETIPDIRGMGAFVFRARFQKNGHFVCFYPLNRCHF